MSKLYNLIKNTTIPALGATVLCSGLACTPIQKTTEKSYNKPTVARSADYRDSQDTQKEHRPQGPPNMNGDDLDQLINKTIDVYTKQVEPKESEYKEHIDEFIKILEPHYQKLKNKDFTGIPETKKERLSDPMGNLGLFYACKKKYEKAIERYNFTIMLDGDDPTTYNNRGRSHFRLGNLDKAISDFERVLELDPKYPDAKGWLEGLKKMKKKREK